MPKIICIGQSCKDIFFPTTEGKIIDTPEDLASKQEIAFELGAKFKIDERYESLGGCAANVASGLARLDLAPLCYSHIGDDQASEWVKQELVKNGVDVSLVSQGKNCKSDLSAIIVDKNSGERIIFSNQSANKGLEIIPAIIKEAEWYFIGDLHGDWENDLETIFKTAAENDIKTAYNPRQSNIHDNAGYIVSKIAQCEILFLNKDESIEIISGLDEPVAREKLDDEIFLVNKLKDLGAKMVVVTDGTRGAWATDGEKIFFAPALTTNAKDTTGAGDAFSSGFLAAHLKDKKIEECLRWGIVNSANSVDFYGGVEGLLDENAISQKIKEVEARQL